MTKNQSNRAPVQVPTPQPAKVRVTIKVLECQNCKGIFETDLPLETALQHRCARCDQTNWKEKNAGKAITKDASAPLELIAEQKKKEVDDEQ